MRHKKGLPTYTSKTRLFDNQQVLTPEKCDRFLIESFRVTEFP
jgi:hypothetical protein